MSRTSKPISSISYNTIDFLKNVLDRLLYLKKIQYYEFIQHFPDADDKKNHIHLYIMPNCNLDLSAFGDYFLEVDPNNDKPLKCMPFRVSNSYGDWYWYSIHDKDYLNSKLLVRNTFYTDNDIISSDFDFHHTLVLENPLINFAKFSDVGLRDYICQCVYNGISLGALLSSGKVPLGKSQSVISFYRALNDFVNSNNRKTFNNSSGVSDFHYVEIPCNVDDLPFKDDLYD